MDEVQDRTIYRVVVNDAAQYSIWPVERDLPAGWRDSGQDRAQGRLPGGYREVVDRHATGELAQLSL